MKGDHGLSIFNMRDDEAERPNIAALAENDPDDIATAEKEPNELTVAQLIEMGSARRAENRDRIVAARRAEMRRPAASPREYSQDEIDAEIIDIQLEAQKRKEPAATGGRASIQLVSFDDIKMAEGAPQLVAGLIPLSSLTLVWGAPKSGKSFKVFDIAMHVARGRDYRGHKVKQGAVAYCIFEGQRGFRNRVTAYRQHHKITAGSGVPFWLMPTRLDLVKQWRDLAEIITNDMPDTPACIVLDTLNRSLKGSESSDQDMSCYIDAADALREHFNCAVIIVHHCGWNDTRSRGHSSLIGAVAAQLSVKRDTGKNIILTVDDMRDGEEGDTVVSRLKVIEIGLDPDGAPITSCVIEPQDEGAAVTGKEGKLNARQQLALEALISIVAKADQKLPADFQLPSSIRCVSVEAWRIELLARGVIDKNGKNPRTDFTRIKTALHAKHRTAEREGFIWPIL